MAESAPVPIEIDVNGKTCKGTYTMDASGDRITVTYVDQEKTAKLGGSASARASMILQELVTGT